MDLQNKQKPCFSKGAVYKVPGKDRRCREWEQNPQSATHPQSKSYIEIYLLEKIYHDITLNLLSECIYIIGL